MCGANYKDSFRIFHPKNMPFKSIQESYDLHERESSVLKYFLSASKIHNVGTYKRHRTIQNELVQKLISGLIAVSLL